MSFSVQISANILSWPRVCACCGDVADTHFRAEASHTKGKRVKHTTTKWWEVPWCSGCAEHSRWFSLSQTALAFIFVVSGVSLVVAFISDTNRIAAILIGGILLAASIWAFRATIARARSLCRANCTARTIPVRYVDWHGTFHTFTFESRSYLDAFIAANDRKTRSDVREV